MGIIICEDISFEDGPARAFAKAGAEVIVVLNASPYNIAKIKEREKIIQKQAQNNKVFIVYANLVGGQDEIVFDGFSMVVNPHGKVIARAEGFAEDLLIIDLPLGTEEQKPAVEYKKANILPVNEEVYKALLTGLKDYVQKNGFKDVVIGLSGGIDSAIVATLAADALGPENVHCVFMPSKYSSIESREDAEQLATKMGIDFRVISIEELFSLYTKVLSPAFNARKPDLPKRTCRRG